MEKWKRMGIKWMDAQNMRIKYPPRIQQLEIKKNDLIQLTNQEIRDINH